MARYTQLTDRDAYAIADAYGLKIIRWQPIAGGYENSSFLLNADQGDYVLTFYEKKSIAGAEYNVQLLNHLAEHGYQTNKVVNTIDGNLISAYRGKPLVLKTWIPGATLRDTVQADYRSIGRAVAKLHNIPAPDFLSQEHPYGLRSMPASLGHQGDHEFDDWLEAKLGYIQSNFPAGLTKTLIHSDLFDDNIIFHRGQFQAIIDFGEACFHPRAYDLGSVLNGACMQVGELSLSRAREVITGYQEVSTLQQEELAAIQFFAVYAGAAISAWHYLNTFIRQPADTKEGRYKLAAQRTEHIFRLPPEEFNTVFRWS